MEAVLGFLGSLAWPVCALWLAYMFRPEIRTVVARLSRLKYKEFEADFAEELSAAEKSLDQIESETKHETLVEPPTISPQLEHLLSIADVAPKAAIIEAWTLIEDAAGRSGFVQGAQIPRINPALYVSWLVREGKIPAENEDTFASLRRLRNLVAHNSDIHVTPSDAQRYLKLAARAVELIEEP